MAAVEDTKIKNISWNDETTNENSDKYDIELVDYTKDEWIEYLINEAKAHPRRSQRDADTSRDHGLSLFSRQKRKPRSHIFYCLISLTAVYGIQLVVLYNLWRLARYVKAGSLTEWIERDVIRNDQLQNSTIGSLNADIRELIGSSEVDFINLPALGFCFSPDGYNEAIFNIGSGMLLIYLFLFFDFWNVIMSTTLTRSFPKEKNGLIMIFGELWLVFVNAAVIIWLGVVAGYSVLAAAGDFYTITQSSLELFIVLLIDETVLPAVRFVIEEKNYINPVSGELSDQRLLDVTHGKQYYKPGYGHRFLENFKSPNPVIKIVAIIAFTVMLFIVIGPFIIVLFDAIASIKLC